MKPKKRGRCPGEVPYPIEYCKQMADFDIWDHMFLSSYLRSLTLHQFVHPPTMVLDLGCGSGFWAIEAAKQWQTSTIIGFDIAKIQPRLTDMEHMRPIARRIEWIHGNLLDGLPFPPEYFDFVRLSGLGLAIPENEWQSVLEEIRRVMKVGAALEIIEEDPIFPCPSVLIQQQFQTSPVHVPSPSPPSAYGTPPDLHRSKSTTFYDRPGTSPEHVRLSLSTTTSTGSVQEYGKFTSRLSNFLPAFSKQYPTYNPKQPSTSTLTLVSPTTTDSKPETEHPQDHTRLKTVWDAMLATRFLSPNIVSVLPFYLTNSSFVDAKVLSSLSVPLPPNSGTLPSLRSCKSFRSLKRKGSELHLADTPPLFDFSPSISARSMTVDTYSIRSSVASTSQPPAAQWGTMHLAKTVNTIRGCKEAMFTEYKKLYSSEALSLLLRTAPDEEDYLSHPHKYVVRKAFEVDWRNWERDMLDRMGMRNNLATHIPWVQATTEPETPDWKKWRETLENTSGSDCSGHLITAYNPDDLCRSLRIFTVVKS